MNLTVGGRHQCSHSLLTLCNNYCRHKTNCTALFSHTPPLLLRMHIPVRLVIPSLDAIRTYFLDEPRKWEEQVRKNVKKRGIKWMKMMEEDTQNDRGRWRFLSKTRFSDKRWHKIRWKEKQEAQFELTTVLQGFILLQICITMRYVLLPITRDPEISWIRFCTNFLPKAEKLKFCVLQHYKSK